MGGAAGQRISLPQGGGAVGGVGETFIADPQTGTGRLRIPIELPPGRAGLGPTLELTYSSGSGASAFGLGWDLPLPSVQRKTSAGVPRYDDTDVFILSGAEDLVPVPGAFEGTRYRPRTEGLFARIERVADAGTDHWLVWTTDGRCSTYGTVGRRGDDPAAIADPQQPDHVARWLISTTVDPLGNRIEYSYAGPLIDEIRYGDYGDRADPSYLCRIRFGYQDRPDPGLTGRSGFIVESTQRCTRIEIWTGREPQAVSRVIDLEYAAPAAVANGVSLLAGLSVTGVDGDQRQALPPLTFGYTGFRPQDRRYLPIEVAGDAWPDAGLAAGTLDLVDLFADGLPSLLELDRTARYWRNRGDGRFDPPRPLGLVPAGVSLRDPGVELIDLDGDGRLELLAVGTDQAGFYRLNAAGAFEPASYVGYASAPSVALRDPEVRLLDLSGDGSPDAVRTADDIELFFNDREAGWTRTASRRRGVDAPDVSFADPRIKIADLTGDGLADIASVADGRVDYWPNLGHGRWGAAIRMSHAPRFSAIAGPDTFDPSRLLLGDVDGDGCADLVYVGEGFVAVWVNQSGRGFSADPLIVRGTPTVPDPTAVRLVDLLGCGTAGVLWSDDPTTSRGSPLKFLDLTGGTKPYLLERVDNGCGAVTTIGYAPSTAYALADEEGGRPWVTTLPIPVQVVSQVVTEEAFNQTRHTVGYAYHHGHWDGAEREFRGFARVDQRDTLTGRRGPDGRPPSERTRTLDFGTRPTALPPDFDDHAAGNLIDNGLFSDGATGWAVRGGPATTVVVEASRLPGREDGSMLHVTAGDGGGIEQPLAVPGELAGSAWIRVLSGRVRFGIDPDPGHPDATPGGVTAVGPTEWQLFDLDRRVGPASVVVEAIDGAAEFWIGAVWVRLDETAVDPDPPPTELRTWYAVGPVGPEFGDWSTLDLSADYWPGDAGQLGPAVLERLPDSLDRRARRDAVRATRGSILRTELYGLDGSQRQGRPYTVTEHQYEVTTLVAGDRPVFFPHQIAERTTQWERGSEPLTRLSFADGHDDYGRVPFRTDFALPRRPGEPILATATATGFATRDDVTHYLADRVSGAAGYEVVNDGSLAWPDLRKRDLAGTAAYRLLSATHHRYDDRPLGELGDWGLLTAQEDLVITEGQLRAACDGPPPPYLAAPVAGSGLRTVYFTDLELGASALTRGEPGVSRQFLGYLPDPVLEPGRWSVRWAGTLQARYSESYTLTLDRAGGARLWLDGQLRIDDWAGAASSSSVTLPLTADDPVEIRVELRADVPAPMIALRWSSASQPAEIVPSDRLRPAPAEDDDVASSADYPSGFTDRLASLAGYRLIGADDPRRHPGYYREVSRRYDVLEGTGVRGNQTAEIDAAGHRTEIGYDECECFPVRVVDPAGLVQQAEIDYRVLQARRSVDACGNLTTVGFTPLGLLAWTSRTGRPDERVGDDADHPSELVTYGLADAAAAGQPLWVHTTRRTRHVADLVAEAEEAEGGPLTADQLAALVPADESTEFPDRFVQSRRYADGLGRELQQRIQASETVVDDLGLGLDPAADTPVGALQIHRVSDPSAPPVTVGGWARYDAKGRVIESAEPYADQGWAYAAPSADQLGGLTRTRYDVGGAVRSTRRPDGGQTLIVAGVPQALDRPDLDQPTPWETWSYDAADNAGRTDPLAGGTPTPVWDTPSTIEIDALGRPVRAVVRLSGQELTTRTEFTPQGWVARRIDPAGRVTVRTRYDLAGRPWRDEHLDSGVNRAVHDASGAVLEHRDAAGGLRLHGYDVAHRLSRVWARDPGRTSTTLLEMIGYGEDPARRPDGTFDPVLFARARSVNTIGRVVVGYDGAGRLTTPAYDFAGNQLERSREVLAPEVLLSGTGAAWSNTSYQLDWQPPPGRTLDHHAAALLAPAAYTISSVSDALGRRRRITLPVDVTGHRAVLSAEYDRAGALRQLELDGTPFVSELLHNPRGQRIAGYFGNGVLVRYGYHPSSGRLVRLRSEPATSSPAGWSPAGPVGQDHRYAYDLAGNLVAILDSAAGNGIAPTPDRLLRLFEHDALNRLISATGREIDRPAGTPWRDDPPGVDPNATRAYRETYRYDALGNLIELGHTNRATRRLDPVAGGNRLAGLTEGQTTVDYAYDAAGRLVGEGDSRQLEWDSAERLATFRVQAGADPSVYAQYRYDSAGARVSKVVLTGAVRTVTVWIDGLFERIERTPAPGVGPLRQDTVHLLDGNRRVALVRVGDQLPGETTPAVQYQLGDHLGSAELTLAADGSAIGREEFSPFGETTFGGWARKRYRFTGKQRDPESGLADHGARCYAPWLARWVSCDPAEDADGPSPYSYVANRPLTSIDPSGRQAEPEEPPPEPPPLAFGDIAMAALRSAVGSRSYAELRAQYQSDALARQQAEAAAELARADQPPTRTERAKAVVGAAASWVAGQLGRIADWAGGTRAGQAVKQVDADLRETAGNVVSDQLHQLNPLQTATRTDNPIALEAYHQSLSRERPMGMAVGGMGYQAFRDSVLQFGLEKAAVGMAAAIAPKLKLTAPIHHIATDKHGSWTPVFREMFEKAGLSISRDPANLLALTGHAGPHPDEYHMWVYIRLLAATDGKAGAAYATALRSELSAIGTDLVANPKLVSPGGAIWR